MTKKAQLSIVIRESSTSNSCNERQEAYKRYSI